MTLPRISLILGSIFTAAAAYAAYNFYSDSYKAYSADLNNDGIADIYLKAEDKIVIISSEINIPILYHDHPSLLLAGNSDGSYSQPILWPANVDVSGMPTAQINTYYADFNGDGLSDTLIQSKHASQDNYIVYGSSSSSIKGFSFDEIEGVYASSDHSTITVRDVNDDGKADIILDNGLSSQRIAIAQNNGTFSRSSLDHSHSNAPKVVGATAGQSNVDPASGYLSYNIPLSLPTGPGGIKPDIGITYNSNGSNGIMGVGFSVTGQSTIHLCGKDRGVDGQITAVIPIIVNGTNPDICLNGQRLVHVSNEAGKPVYRLANDTFKKVVASDAIFSDSTYFTAYDKSGDITVYGSYSSDNPHTKEYIPNSIIQDGINTGYIKSSQYFHVLNWHASEKKDRFGNTIRYFYNIDNEHHYLSSISYGSNTVRFQTEERADTSFGYNSGLKFKRSKRLDKINVTVNSQVFRTYDFDYEYAPITSQSRITSLTECGADGTCFNPTTFEWNNAEGRIDFETSYEASGNLCADKSNEYGGCNGDENYGSITPLDANADGFLDFCFKADDGMRCHLNDGNNNFVKSSHIYSSVCKDNDDANGCNSNNNTRNIQFLDFNLDGVSDFVYRADDGIRIYEIKSTGFELLVNTGIWGNQNSYEDDMYNSVQYPELNGDGIPDICFRRYKGIVCNFSTGLDKFKKFPLYSGNDLSYIKVDGVSTWICYIDRLPCENQNNHRTIGYADFNGDGLDDLGVRYNTGFVAFTSNGVDGFNTYAKTAICANSADPNGGCREDHSTTTVNYPDVNGDGLADVCYRSDIGIHCAYSNGLGFESNDGLSAGDLNTTLCANSECASHSLYNDGKPHYINFIDFDHDGKPELLYRSTKHGVRIHKITGQETVDITPVSTSKICEDGEPECDGSQNHRTINVADFDNDGGLDLIYKGDTGIKVHKSALRNILKADKLAKVVNGHGLYTRIEYGSLMDSSVYTTNESHVYIPDYVDNYVTTPKHASLVVKTVATPAPNGMENALRYVYQNKKQNISGHGYSGFEYTTIYKNANASLTAFEQKTSINIGAKFGQFGKIRSELDYVNGWQGALVGGSGTQWAYRTLIKDPTVLSTGTVTHSFQYKTLASHYINSTSNRIKRTESFTYLDGNTSTQPNSYTLSDYGNVTKQVATTTVKAGTYDLTSTITTNNTFWNDVTGWQLGKLKDSTVTKSSTQIDGTTATSTKKSKWNYYESGTFKGLVKDSIIEPGHATLEQTNSFTYYDFGKVKTETISGKTGKSSTTTYEYDSGKRFVTKKTNNKGHYSTTSYHDVLGLPTADTDINGRVTLYYYDGYGRLEETIKPFGSITKAKLVLDTNKLGGSNSYYYLERTSNTGGLSREYFNTMGNVIRTMKRNLNGESILQDTNYNRDTSVYRTSLPYKSGTQPHGWTTIVERDDRYRPIQIQSPTGSVERLVYDGHKTTTYNALNQTKIVLKNGAGKVLESTSHNGETLQYIYDADGHIHKAIDVSGATQIVNQFDVLGNKISTSDPDKGNWQYSYNALGQLISQTNSKGFTTCFVYDELGRKHKQIEEYKGSASQAYNDCNQTGVTAGKQSTWYYDTAPKGSTGLFVKGAPHKVVHHSGYEEIINYDSFARIAGTSRKINGETFTQSNTYDIYGRANTVTFPTGLTLKTEFNDYGYKTAVKNSDSQYTYWEAKDVDVFGNVIEKALGNGLKDQRWYKQDSGLLDYVVVSNTYTTPGNLTATDPIHVEQYHFDQLGNLKWREDRRMELYETYDYDSVNRLTTTKLYANGNKTTPVAQDTMQYYANGNIKFKPGVGTYNYGGTCNNQKAGPHAVTSITGEGHNMTLCYDANGNMLTDGTRTLQYGNTFDKPVRIEHNDGNLVNFAYDQSHKRYYRKDTQNGDVTETFYAGASFEVVKKSGSINETLYKHYIGGIAVEVHKKDVPTFKQINYLHKDHLGSVITITDDSGSAIERHTYDAWGQKRNLDWRKINGFEINPIIAPKGDYAAYKGDVDGDGKQDVFIKSTANQTYAQLYKGKGDGNFAEGIAWSSSQSTAGLTLTNSIPFSSNVTTRGFGGHEQLDGVGLIHMGGRVYDPVLARFLSADLFIQSTTNYQAFNRYSYTLNNPQSYTDPSGYIWKKIVGYASQNLLFNMTGGAYQLFKEKFDHKADQFADWARYAAGANPEAAALVQISGCLAATSAGGTYGCAAFQAAYTAFLTKDLKQGVRAGAVAAATAYVWSQVHTGLDGTTANSVEAGGTGNADWLNSYSDTQVSLIKTGVHMAVGGTISAIQGNGFARGAAVAGVSKGFYEADLSLSDGPVYSTLEAAIIGGTTSKIGGGEFAQGAMLAAYARLFNDTFAFVQPGYAQTYNACANTDSYEQCNSDARLLAKMVGGNELVDAAKKAGATKLEKTLLGLAVKLGLEVGIEAMCCYHNQHLFNPMLNNSDKLPWTPLDADQRDILKELEVGKDVTDKIKDSKR